MNARTRSRTQLAGWLAAALMLAVLPATAQETALQQAPALQGELALGAERILAPSYTERYLVTYMKNDPPDGSDPRGSATTVNVTNLNSAPCYVKVSWYDKRNTLRCSTALWLDIRDTVNFCSRRLPPFVTDCDAFCSDDDKKEPHEGRAIVLTYGCEHIGVGSGVYYTDSEDRTVMAVSNPKVVATRAGNYGD